MIDALSSRTMEVQKQDKGCNTVLHNNVRAKGATSLSRIKASRQCLGAQPVQAGMLLKTTFSAEDSPGVSEALFCATLPDSTQTIP